MKKLLSTLLALAALLALALTLASCSETPADNATPDLSEYATVKSDILALTVDFGAFLVDKGVVYNDAWDVPSVMDAQKAACVQNQLGKAVSIDWDGIKDKYIAQRKDYVVNRITQEYEQYKMYYYQYGITSAAAYVQAAYKTSIDDYADTLARQEIQSEILYAALLAEAKLLPDEEAVLAFYDKQLESLVSSSAKTGTPITKEEFEQKYEDMYGKGYLYTAIRADYYRTLAIEYVDEKWTMTLPEIDPASKPTYDKSPLTPSEYVETQEQTDLVKITIKTAKGTAGGDIYVRLYGEAAPLTVANFKTLVSKGFYDGLIFHRSVPGFCLQGGDPEGNGTGGADKTVKGEFYQNGHANHLSHLNGVLSMARGQGNNSGSSQFFITLSDNNTTALNGKYAAFGYVVYGMDLVEKLSAIPADGNEKPTETITMEKVVFVKAAQS